MAKTPQLPKDWMAHLGPEFEKDYMVQLRGFLAKELSQGKVIYPHGREIFASFNLTPLEQVKVVVLGQDPYHGPNQAHGLCFSVKKGVPPPPSLVNIFQEIQEDIGLTPPSHGFLEGWAKQGVLLLNSVLTVERHRAASHRNRGWEEFTDKVVEVLTKNREHLVFFLWGSYAQRKGIVIDTSKHKVLTSPHPSPLSAHRGFFGCRHFSTANRYLESVGLGPVDWALA